MRAYELLNGPIGPHYEQEALAAIHEQLQNLTSTLIQINIKDPEDAPAVQHYPRPSEVFKRQEV